MKKIIGIVLSLFLLTGCFGGETTKSLNKGFKINNQILTPTKDDLGYETLRNVDHSIAKVDVNTLKAMNKIDQPYFLMIGRPSCSHCQDAIPLYAKLAKKNGVKNIYYWSFENIYQKTLKNQKLSNQENKDVKYLEDVYKFDGSTPMFYLVKKGKIFDSTLNYAGNSWEEILATFYKNTVK
jgi:thiol-disulfide isomerase/thioredoxin